MKTKIGISQGGSETLGKGHIPDGDGMLKDIELGTSHGHTAMSVGESGEHGHFEGATTGTS